MRRGWTPATPALLLCALLALLAPAAAQAGRSVPPQFFGMNWDDEISMDTAPQALQDRQFARMATAGVESVRATFVWADAQPNGPDPTDFTQTDRIVGAAAAHGISVLPVLLVAPEWERAFETYFSPPSDPGDFSAYLVKLVHRYGPRGSFWAENPRLPRLPIRAWQVWNEPHLQYQWDIPTHEDWAIRYSQLVNGAYTALHHADRGGKLVLAGLANESPGLLGHLLHYGVNFDVAAIHPYTAKASGVLTLAREARAVMKRHHAGGKPLWITELGLPASRGRAQSRNTLQTTDSGMTRFLAGSYRNLASQWRKLGVTRAYWYTWASSYSAAAGPAIFDFSGLLRWTGSGGPSARPAYAAYVRAARRYEGCAKTTLARCR